MNNHEYCRIDLPEGFEQLVTDGLHAADGGMAILLVNVVELDELDVVVLTDFTHRLVDGLAKLGVQKAADGGLGIALLELVKQTG